MILNYDFTAINEGELPSVIVQRNINKDNYHIDVHMPMMSSGSLLVEDPSAPPYEIPIPVGIREAYVSAMIARDYNIQLIAKNFSMPLFTNTTVSIPSNKTDLGLVELNTRIYNSSGYTATRGETGSELQSNILTAPNISSYSGVIRWPVINGKSPKTLFKVDGSGNSIQILKNTGSFNVAPTIPLFSLIFTQIKFGGVPSEDY